MCRFAPIIAILLSSVIVTFSSVIKPLTNGCFIVHELMTINQNQTANIQIVFLGISEGYINESRFKAGISKTASQFSYPNTIKWNLNVSIQFCDFSKDISDSLTREVFYFESSPYYNVTLLDSLLSEQQDIAIPDNGCLVVFMWIADNVTNHSWFFVRERPDLWLGTTEYLNNVSYRYWAFPPRFGGIRRALYFDLTDIMENPSTVMNVTTHAINQFNNGLNDIFMSLLLVKSSPC